MPAQVVAVRRTPSCSRRTASSTASPPAPASPRPAPGLRMRVGPDLAGRVLDALGPPARRRAGADRRAGPARRGRAPPAASPAHRRAAAARRPRPRHDDAVRPWPAHRHLRRVRRRQVHAARHDGPRHRGRRHRLRPGRRARPGGPRVPRGRPRYTGAASGSSPSSRPRTSRRCCGCAPRTPRPGSPSGYRDQGADVLLLVDWLTRFAMARREIGLAAGEPPATRGYPPSVFAELPRLLERAGPGERGTITALYTVLVEGDDMNDPVADHARSILDGHIVLSRRLAAAGPLPHHRRARERRRGWPARSPRRPAGAGRPAAPLLAAGAEAKDLVEIGAYVPGTDRRRRRGARPARAPGGVPAASASTRSPPATQAWDRLEPRMPRVSVPAGSTRCCGCAALRQAGARAAVAAATAAVAARSGTGTPREPAQAAAAGAPNGPVPVARPRGRRRPPGRGRRDRAEPSCRPGGATAHARAAGLGVARPAASALLAESAPGTAPRPPRPPSGERSELDDLAGRRLTGPRREPGRRAGPDGRDLRPAGGARPAGAAPGRTCRPRRRRVREPAARRAVRGVRRLRHVGDTSGVRRGARPPGATPCWRPPAATSACRTCGAARPARASTARGSSRRSTASTASTCRGSPRTRPGPAVRSPPAQARPGDLVAFDNSSARAGIDHIGIYPATASGSPLRAAVTS